MHNSNIVLMKTDKFGCTTKNKTLPHRNINQVIHFRECVFMMFCMQKNERVRFQTDEIDIRCTFYWDLENLAEEMLKNASYMVIKIVVCRNIFYSNVRCDFGY